MADPVIIAKRTTTAGGGTLPLDNLSAPDDLIPANPATVQLSDWNSTSQIQEDPQLTAYIDTDLVLLNVDGIDLTKEESLNVVSSVTSISNPGAIPRVKTVSLGGLGADYASIKTAVDAVVAAGASASTPWLVEVYSGTYTEAKITVPIGVTVSTPGGRSGEVTVVPTVPTDDLIVLNGGALAGLTLRGVTDASKACVRVAFVGNSVIRGCVFTDCSIGVLHTGADVLLSLSDTAFIVRGAAQAITTGYRAEAGCTGALVDIKALVTATVSALYGGSNALQTVLDVTGAGTDVGVAGSNFLVNTNAAAEMICVDDGAQIHISASTLVEGDMGVRIGSVGSGTRVVIVGGVLVNTTNFVSDSSTGIFQVFAAVDHETTSLVAGASFMGVLLEEVDNHVGLHREVDYYYPTGRDLDLGIAHHTGASTGLLLGGAVTDGGGLTADVAAGTGMVVRDSPSQDAENVSWSAAPGLVLTPSTTNYVVYNGVSQALAVELAPSAVSSIQLAIIETDGTGIRYLHKTDSPVEHSEALLHQYLLDTRIFAIQSGITPSVGSTVRKLDVTAGSYYRAISLISVAGSGGDATWSAFYGLNGASEVASVTDIDITQYDNAGTLTAMTGGYFRMDSVLITSDNRISVIYGSAEFSTQTAAEAIGFASIPSFLEETSCTLARVIVEQGVGIVDLTDVRPVPSAVGGGIPEGGVTDHGALTGLGDSVDHLWAMLVDGTRAMTGDLDMGGNAVTNVGNVDGVDVSAHAARHLPGGLDALTTAVPSVTTVGGSPAEGAAASFARSDHDHGDLVVSGQTQGDVLYFNGANWTRLPPGTSGEFFQTQGAAANPIWAAVASGDLAVVQVRRSATLAVPLAFTDIPFDTTDVENDTSVLEHNAVNTDNVDVKETGLYLIWFQVSVDADAGEETFDMRVRVNDTSVIAGSERQISEDDEINDLGNVFVVLLTAGDFITFQLLGSGAGNVLLAESTYGIMRMRGLRGATGATGSGSSITVEDNGTPVAGGPHDTLDFVGDGVSVSDAGGGEATVTQIWGRHSQTAEMTTPPVGTTGAFVEVLSMTTGTLTAGTYRIGWFVIGRNTNTAGDWDLQVQVDDTTNLIDPDNGGQMREEGIDAGTDQKYARSGFRYLALTAAAHTIDIDVGNNGGGTASIFHAVLEIWRVS